MPSPFPGMDPYLEHPGIWPSVHPAILIYLRESLSAVLPPPYWLAVETRVYRAEDDDALLIGIPDAIVGRSRPTATGASSAVLERHSAIRVTLPEPVEIRERYLEIRHPEVGNAITVIEALSPANKRAGEGRAAYLRKREEVISSETNLVELDLLRAGDRMPMRGAKQQYDYAVLVSRANERPSAELLPFTVMEAAPRFPVPLIAGEAEPEVDLQHVLNRVYDSGTFDRRIDYAKPPAPELRREAREWAVQLLKNKGIVSGLHSF